MKILFIGDIVGRSGRLCVKEYIKENKNSFDFIIANAENAVSGAGITYPVVQELKKYGVDCITMGNHTFSKKEVYHFIDSEKTIIRPANYPTGVEGKGYIIIEKKGIKICVINLLGRLYMNNVFPDSPFITANNLLKEMKNKELNAILIDFHAEATSEKMALAWYLDGKISAMFGTHTHVQTADERILPCGTSFISDTGMTGPYDSILGVKKELIIDKFIKQKPVYMKLANGRNILNAVSCEIDNESMKTTSIKRISKIYEDLRK